MASKSKKSKLTMMLLVDSKGQRVPYGEAGKDVVDFLFSLLTLPVGTVASLLAATPTRSMVGNVGNLYLYGSVEKLDDAYYICRDDAKAALLAPAGSRGDLLRLPVVSGRRRRQGFVHGAVTYTVMDDLKIAPMSTISGITLLNTFGVTDIGSLQEITVELGEAEFRCTLRSKMVLTDVFLGEKRKTKRKAEGAFLFYSTRFEETRAGHGA